jgi:hypothetical protein
MVTRRSVFSIGLLAILLWIAGLAISSAADNLSDAATDQQVLTWVQANKTPIWLGFWVFAIGSVVFVWFLTEVRAALGAGTLPNLFYATGVGAALLSMLTPADAVTAIQDNGHITAAAAGAMHHFGDLPFMAAELALMGAFAAFGVHALRTRVVPRWWAYVTLFVALVLLVGPIGWAALIFGTPVWTAGTGWLFAARAEHAPTAAPAV